MDNRSNRGATSKTHNGTSQIGHAFRVLVADDDDEMRRLLTWSFKEKAYDVVECRDGNELMKHLGFLDPLDDRSDIDVIISDIRMPGTTGLQVLEYAKELDDFPPIILITAFPDQKTQIQAKQLGAQALIAKPFNIEELIATVNNIAAPIILARSGRYPVPQKALLVKQKEVPVEQYAMDIIFRGKSKSAPIEAFVHEMAAKINHHKHAITHCHVVLERSETNHKGKHKYHVHIHLSLKGKTIAISRDSEHGYGLENPYLAIRVAFGAANRQLKSCYERKNRHM